MPVQNLKYCEYFDVNEKYFPCIDESAINSGAAGHNLPSSDFHRPTQSDRKDAERQYKPLYLDSWRLWYR